MLFIGYDRNAKIKFFLNFARIWTLKNSKDSKINTTS